MSTAAAVFLALSCCVSVLAFFLAIGGSYGAVQAEKKAEATAKTCADLEMKYSKLLADVAGHVRGFELEYAALTRRLDTSAPSPELPTIKITDASGKTRELKTLPLDVLNTLTGEPVGKAINAALDRHIKSVVKECGPRVTDEGPKPNQVGES